MPMTATTTATDVEQKIVSYIATHPNSTTIDICQGIGISERSANRYLGLLIEQRKLIKIKS